MLTLPLFVIFETSRLSASMSLFLQKRVARAVPALHPYRLHKRKNTARYSQEPHLLPALPAHEFTIAIELENSSHLA